MDKADEPVALTEADASVHCATLSGLLGKLASRAPGWASIRFDADERAAMGIALSLAIELIEERGKAKSTSLSSSSIQIEAPSTAINSVIERLEEVKPEPANVPKPESIPLLLWCPECGERHVEGDLADVVHHTHACQHCGNTWRPAVVPTSGVRFLPGFRDRER